MELPLEPIWLTPACPYINTPNITQFDIPFFPTANPPGGAPNHRRAPGRPEARAPSRHRTPRTTPKPYSPAQAPEVQLRSAPPLPPHFYSSHRPALAAARRRSAYCLARWTMERLGAGRRPQAWPGAWRAWRWDFGGWRGVRENDGLQWGPGKWSGGWFTAFRVSGFLPGPDWIFGLLRSWVPFAPSRCWRFAMPGRRSPRPAPGPAFCGGPHTQTCFLRSREGWGNGMFEELVKLEDLDSAKQLHSVGISAQRSSEIQLKFLNHGVVFNGLWSSRSFFF